MITATTISFKLLSDSFQLVLMLIILLDLLT